MGSPRLRLCEIDVVGRHKGDIILIGPGDKPRFGDALACEPVSLQFHIEAITKGGAHRAKRFGALPSTPCGEKRINGPVCSTRQQDQSLGQGDNTVPGNLRWFRRLHHQKGVRRQLTQVAVANFVLCEKDNRRRASPSVPGPLTDSSDWQGAANDRLHSRVLRRDRKLERAEEICAIRQRYRRHAPARA